MFYTVTFTFLLRNNMNLHLPNLGTYLETIGTYIYLILVPTKEQKVPAST